MSRRKSWTRSSRRRASLLDLCVRSPPPTVSAERASDAFRFFRRRSCLSEGPVRRRRCRVDDGLLLLPRSDLDPRQRAGPLAPRRRRSLPLSNQHPADAHDWRRLQPPLRALLQSAQSQAHSRRQQRRRGRAHRHEGLHRRCWNRCRWLSLHSVSDVRSPHNPPDDPQAALRWRDNKPCRYLSFSQKPVHFADTLSPQIGQ